MVASRSLISGLNALWVLLVPTFCYMLTLAGAYLEACSTQRMAFGEHYHAGVPSHFARLCGGKVSCLRFEHDRTTSCRLRSQGWCWVVISCFCMCQDVCLTLRLFTDSRNVQWFSNFPWFSMFFFFKFDVPDLGERSIRIPLIGRPGL